MRPRLSLLATTMLAVSTSPPIGDTSAAAPVLDCGPEWAIVASPNASGRNHLNAVAVVTEDDAWAVGNHLSDGTFETLTEHWNGTAWEFVASPNDGAQDNSLNGVAAVASEDVWAVGFGHGAGGRMTTLALHWDGSAWTQTPTPNVGTDENVLTAVVAITSADVWAVGFFFDEGVRRTLILHFDGSAWAQVPSPNAGGVASVLTDVHAVSTSDVWAVGWTILGAWHAPLVEHWDGVSWKRIAAPRRSGEADFLTSLTGISTTDLWAVGYGAAPTEHRSLAQHWDGARWSVSPTPGPGPNVDIVRAVAAVGPSDVWAVGNHQDAVTDFYRAFSLHYDGTQWAEVPTPDVESDELRGLAVVPSTGRLWAVGTQSGATLIETICPGGSDRFWRAPVPDRRSPTRDRDPSPAAPQRSPTVGGDPAGRAVEVYAVDDAAAAGIAQETHTWNAPVADIDGDLWPDLFIGGHKDPGHLYRNEAGTFVEIAVGVFHGRDRHDCAWADVNLDGLLDLFCSVGSLHGLALKANDLQVQQPGFEFVDQTAEFALQEPFGRGRHLTFIDANHDPYLDLFVENFAVRGDGMPSSNRLYLNDRGAVFRRSPASGLEATTGEKCAQAVDYDNDGWEDLMFCASFGQGVQIYRNLAGDRFVDVSEQVGLTEETTAGAVMTDLNGDGFVDLAQVTESELLVKLQQDGVLTTVYTRALLSGAWVTPGDANADGRPDLYVVQGGRETNLEDVMLLNDGDGTTFTELAIPQTTAGCGDAASAIDYNGNGLTDFVVLNGCGGGPPGPIQLISFYQTGGTGTFKRVPG